MQFEDRKLKILELIDAHGALSFKKLSEKCNVSEATIRRDLSQLEKENLLVRFRGGARKVSDVVEKTMNTKQYMNIKEKKIIGEFASKYIEPNELIFIGSGSTTLALIDSIQDTSITVITNGIPHAEALNKKSINTFLLCGFFKKNIEALVGKETIKLLSTFHFDRAFIGVNGISADLDILSADEYEHEIKSLAIKNSKKIHVLADHSKFNKTAMYSIPSTSIKGLSLITDLIKDGFEKYSNILKT